jgi:hypothetical protein
MYTLVFPGNVTTRLVFTINNPMALTTDGYGTLYISAANTIVKALRPLTNNGAKSLRPCGQQQHGVV